MTTKLALWMLLASIPALDSSAALAASRSKAAKPPVVSEDPEDVRDAEEDAALQAQIESASYSVRGLPGTGLQQPAPRLPDLSGYTAEAVLKKLEPLKGKRGTVSVRRIMNEPAFAEFTGSDGRLAEWAKRQRSNPQAIFIENGYVTPADLAKAVAPTYFVQQQPGVYLARIPVLVKPGATLHIDAATKDFRLSEDGGSFLVNDGKLFMTGSRLTAWRESAKGPASFRDGAWFRPFFLSWGGSETYITDSVLSSLGYAKSKSYGFSISQYSPGMVDRMKRPPPTGWLINNEFVDHWYGFYCYEADDVVIKGNIYRDNIVYGIDPHDRSRRLIIAENTVYGTKKKHGIIISREVNDSWIFRNRSYRNGLSGIVIDRSSVRNVVAYNDSYDNESDGITIYESAENLIWENKVTANKRHGIRLRNSTDIDLYGNIALANGLSGIYGHIKDLTGTDRNLELDPFDPRVSMVVVGGELIANGSAPVAIDKPLSVELYDVKFLAPRKKVGIQLTGVLGQHQEQILDLLVRQRVAVMIEPQAKAQLNKTADGKDAEVAPIKKDKDV